MPAIQLARLKAQTLYLSGLLKQPSHFIRQLHSLLERYSDHTHRSGMAGLPAPILDSYNVPAPVLRQVYVDVKPLIPAHPLETLALCDALWQQRYLEFRSLAAMLIGQVTCPHAEAVIHRLSDWEENEVNERLAMDILKHGLARMRLDCPEPVLALLSRWLESSDVFSQRCGLRLLFTLVEDPAFANLPSLYKLFSPFLRSAPLPIRPDILAVLSGLARRFPPETAYLLRQSLSAPGNPDTPWLIRQVLDDFPSQQQTSLRAALKQAQADILTD